MNIMKLSEFFKNANTKDIVINTDIDGFLCGMILHKYYGCRVVGFSNSKEYIWLTPEIESIYDPVYIDIFINNEDTFCIDQHIVAYDDNHLKRIMAYGTKLNPNLDILKRTYEESFTKKYPFGTVHYLIALMQLDNINISFNDLRQEVEVEGVNNVLYKVCPGQVILRADDALYSSLGPYCANANDWWGQLRSFQSPTIEELYCYLRDCNPMKNDEYKRDIGDFFVYGLKCDAPDGAFKDIIDREHGGLQQRVRKYCDAIGKIVGMSLELPTQLKTYMGDPIRTVYSEKLLDLATTYAFIYSKNGKKRDMSFSCTLDIK